MLWRKREDRDRDPPFCDYMDIISFLIPCKVSKEEIRCAYQINLKYILIRVY